MTSLDLLYIPLALATAPAWAFKKRAGWAQRFGRVQAPQRSSASPKRPRLLIHAVSVGEVSALRGLVPLLLPHADIIISATTDTGLARAQELFAGNCTVVRYPLDFSWSVRRFLNALQPDAVALVELEVWPQFVRACAARSTPICVINGRLSERSFRGYSRIRGFFAGVLSHLAFAAVQDHEYAQRFEALGMPQDKVLLTGTMKWDAVQVPQAPSHPTISVRESVAALVSTIRARMQRDATTHTSTPVATSPPPALPDTPLPRIDVPGSDDLARELGIDRSKPLVVAGSTAEDEEALLVASLPPGAQLLCAPRKPEHYDLAARAMGSGVIRRSARPAGSGTTPRVGPASGRFLLDSMGELRKAYALADIVVIGRSFGTLHGSDPIEPIALGKPTLIGPRFGDFATVVEALTKPLAPLAPLASKAMGKSGGTGRSATPGATGLRIVDRTSLAPIIRELLADPAQREAMTRAGWACVRAHQGASERHAALLLALATSCTPAPATQPASPHA